MTPDQIRAGRCYMNAFGTSYRVYEIDGDQVVFRIEGLAMPPRRMPLEGFARHVVREIPDETQE